MQNSLLYLFLISVQQLTQDRLNPWINFEQNYILLLWSESLRNKNTGKTFYDTGLLEGIC